MPLPENARVLLIRLSAMGDVLFSLETLAALKAERPDVRIDFLVEDRFAALLEGHPQIERLLVYPRRRKPAILAALRALRAQRYDCVLDLHGNLKSAVHARLARSRLRLGYSHPIARERADLLYHTAVRLPEARPHRAEQGYHLLRHLGLRAAPARARLGLPPAQPTAADGAVVLHPGTSAFAAFKRWPTTHFAALTKRLVGHGLPVAVSTGPGEHALAAELCAAGAAHLDGSALGLRGLAAALARARVVVAADTGPLHLAAAAGTPVVALFGPKDAALYGPRGQDHRVLFAETPCRPCRRRQCASPQCVLGIAVGDVEAAVQEVWNLAPSDTPTPREQPS